MKGGGFGDGFDMRLENGMQMDQEPGTLRHKRTILSNQCRGTVWEMVSKAAGSSEE